MLRDGFFMCARDGREKIGVCGEYVEYVGNAQYVRADDAMTIIRLRAATRIAFHRKWSRIYRRHNRAGHIIPRFSL